MCQMRIILKQGDREEVVLENAALLQVTAEGIMVNAMFEPPKLILGAAVSRIDFLENKVTMVKIGKPAGHESKNDNRKTADPSPPLDRT